MYYVLLNWQLASDYGDQKKETNAELIHQIKRSEMAKQYIMICTVFFVPHIEKQRHDNLKHGEVLLLRTEKSRPILALRF